MFGLCKIQLYRISSFFPFGSWRSASRLPAGCQRYSPCDPMRPETERCAKGICHEPKFWLQIRVITVTILRGFRGMRGNSKYSTEMESKGFHRLWQRTLQNQTQNREPLRWTQGLEKDIDKVWWLFSRLLCGNLYGKQPRPVSQSISIEPEYPRKLDHCLSCVQWPVL